MITVILIAAFFFCVAVLVIAYYGSRLEKHFPWLWTNIGQPLFEYFFVLSDKKLMKAYFITVGSICAGNPLAKLLLGTEITKGDLTVRTVLGVDTGIIDIWVFGIVVAITLALVVYLWITHRNDSKLLHKPNKTLVVMYAANIANDTPVLSYKMALDSLPEDYEPVEGSPIRIQIEGDPNDPDFWRKEVEALEREFKSTILSYMNITKINHVSLFSLASMPLLIKLGTLLNEKYSVEVYQKHRTPDNWFRLNEVTSDFIVIRPDNTSLQPVLIMSLSDNIRPRIEAIYGSNASLWEVTIPNPNMDMMRTKKQQEDFRAIIRELFSEISRSSGFDEIKVHMAMPIAAAVEFGRVWMAKPHKSLALYDYRGGKENYTITIKDN